MKIQFSVVLCLALLACKGGQESGETFSGVEQWLPDPSAMRFEDGTLEHPYFIPVDEHGMADYRDSRDTTQALSDRFDTYPPFEQNESGPEIFYVFEIERPSQVDIWLDYPEPEGVDVDVHLLTGVAPLEALDRHHFEITGLYKPGTYYISVDTWVDDDGYEYAGDYTLNVGIEPFFAGDKDSIIPLEIDVETPVTLPLFYVDARDTSEATSREFDTYAPYSYDETGPEYIYGFTVDERVRFSAELIAPVPSGVDVDLHLLDALSEEALISRDDSYIFAYLEPGTYYITADTFGGLAGEYELMVNIRRDTIEPNQYFNEYMLKAVDYLYAEYGILGYDSAVLTHDIDYGDYGVIEASGGAKTMCVGAVLEVILTAMEIYAEETGDETVWDYLPERSWERLGAGDFKAHLWVNYDLESLGSADALRHFGMGETIRFEDLLPGAVVNVNRTTGTGHAVVFLAFIDENGVESTTWHERVVGFLYFSAQGGYDVGAGGLDYRYAIFDQYGSPTMPYKRDTKIIYSLNQTYLNTGMVFHPTLWRETPYVNPTASYSKRVDRVSPISKFDPFYFSGWTVDDVK